MNIRNTGIALALAALALIGSATVASAAEPYHPTREQRQTFAACKVDVARTALVHSKSYPLAKRAAYIKLQVKAAPQTCAFLLDPPVTRVDYVVADEGVFAPGGPYFLDTACNPGDLRRFTEVVGGQYVVDYELTFAQGDTAASLRFSIPPGPARKVSLVTSCSTS